MRLVSKDCLRSTPFPGDTLAYMYLSHLLIHIILAGDFWVLPPPLAVTSTTFFMVGISKLVL